MDSWASVNRARCGPVKGGGSHGWLLPFFWIRDPNLIIPFELPIAILFSIAKTTFSLQLYQLT